MNSLINFALFSALVNGGYIVTLKSQTRSDPTVAHLAKVRSLFSSNLRMNNPNEIKHIFNTTFSGYSADLSRDVLKKIKAMPEVEAVEEDQVVKAFSRQSNAPWGLARLSSSGTISKNSRDLVYTFDPSGGKGVDVYVIDTGINIKHPEFEGRAVWGANFIFGSPNTDENGHGTHCAGTIASRAYGVAKSATVIAVKVLDAQGRGRNSQIITGIEWVIRRKRRGSVINMSLGSDWSAAINRAVRAAVRAGIVVSVAAGNDNADACNISPASELSVITVGASNVYDARASFSNWGRCLDVFAPGEDILSTWNYAYSKTLSGTSMASPHVAGLAAYFMTQSGKTSPEYITSLINLHSQKNSLSNVSYSPNLLVSNLP
ncbi:proteinase B [Entomophthora muscae]|uniref:Proteinase B n=1 Tax=Entomophthora muscae TaxID=34485 RepID=A0ACC2SVK0_9FUNG|nr:proteinase B [Entomophthora muscae]